MQSRVVGLTAFLLKTAIIFLAIFAGAIFVGLVRAGVASLSAAEIPVKEFMTGELGSTIILLIAIIVNIYILKNILNLVSNFRKNHLFIILNVKYLDNICTLILYLKILSIMHIAFNVHDENFHFYENFYGSWLGILMAFIFARVFEEGVRLNEESQLTV
jgi:hypothetical protein